MNYKPTYTPFGETAILIEWPAKIDEDIIQDIVSFEKLVATNQQVLDTIIAYNSLTIVYAQLTNYSKTVAQLKEVYQTKREAVSKTKKLWQIPVCYHESFGIDLKEIATQKELTIDEVIALHTAPKYLLYFIGFQPGFLYLGGLNPAIHTPRKSTPRLRVDKGSVGIGGEQTGVYPQDSSGGWNLIGKSPINFFDISKEQPCFANPGDRIQFVAIDVFTFTQIEKDVKRGVFHLKFEWI